MFLPVEKAIQPYFWHAGQLERSHRLTGGATGKRIRGGSFGPSHAEAAGAFEQSDIVDAFRAIRQASLPVSPLTRRTCPGFPSGPARTSKGDEAGPSRRTKRPSLRAGWGSDLTSGEMAAGPAAPVGATWTA